MIIARISSGLGNQLFQYATAKALSIRNGDILKLDISYYSQFTDRNYGLLNFNVTDEIANSEEINKLKGNYRTNFFLKIKRRLAKTGIEYYNKYHVSELPFTSFDKEVLKLKGDIYLDGYWQNEMYFRDIRYQLCQIFQLKDKPDKYYAGIADQILSTNSVSVHVRRGDYITNKTFSECSNQYYIKAFDYITDKIKDPVFFIFTDDPDWTKENLVSKHNLIHISPSAASKEHVELFLMSQCKHNIIANSSFSWFGAWLNNNSNKIVICPSSWISDKKLNRRKTSNRFTLDWIKI